MDEVKQAILELIERETTAFLCRDFDAWAECWIHDEAVRRLAALTGGVTDYQEGWATGSDAIRNIFDKFPLPNPEAAESTRRSNFSIRVSGDMAWASFDQYGEMCEDPLVTAGLSHEVRVFEKQAEHWKIAMVGHADSGLEYFDFPVIRIDDACRIEWMNDAARSELITHSALTKSGAHLRGRYGSDDKRLRKTVKEVSSLTVMDRRPSLQEPRGRVADPVILNGEAADGQHIVWVSAYNGTLLVTFRDSNNERKRLIEAAELYQLSPAQMSVAELVLEGRSLHQVAEGLGVAVSTAKTHLTRVFDKTGARNQSALVSKLLGVSPPI
jgi:DNA-binding CsgD family transcriptional regulator